MIKQTKKVILATGGTGGHIFPALALRSALIKEGVETIVAADAKFSKFHVFDDQHLFIPSANFSNKSPLAILKSLFILTNGFLKSLWLILSYKPDLIIGFGGYASYPIMFASVILRKEIILHEANTVIGKVNKLILPRAKYLTTGFKNIQNVPENYKDKIVYTGNPVREEIAKAAKEKRRTAKDKLSILIIGGSQGAKIFSKMIPDAIINLPEQIKKKLYIFQQVKEEDITSINEKYSNEHVNNEIKSFFTDMSEKLKSVDLVIARSGASTIAELIEFNLPAIFIPYPFAADNHQYFNAQNIVDIEGGWLVEESPNSHVQILQIIKLIERDDTILAKYSENLKILKQDACANILKLIK